MFVYCLFHAVEYKSHEDRFGFAHFSVLEFVILSTFNNVVKWMNQVNKANIILITASLQNENNLLTQLCQFSV